MIEYIKIKNFLSHKNTNIRFSHGVNAIIGDSDSGKSAVMKALDWVINNKPAGDEFVSWTAGKESTTVEIGINGRKIIRKRTKSENSYQVDDNDPYRAFGQGVPEDVQKIINIQDVNIHRQPDSPFLLSETSGKVANYINQIAKLDIMQQSMARANLAVKRRKRQLGKLEDDLVDRKEEIKEFNWIDNADGYLEELKSLQNRINKTRSQYNQLSRLINEIKNRKPKLESFRWVDSAARSADKAVEIMDSIKQAKGKRRDLSRVCDHLESSKTKIKKYRWLSKAVKETRELDNELTRLKDKQDEFDSLSSITNRLADCEDRIGNLPPPAAEIKLKKLLSLDYNIKETTESFNSILDITEAISDNEEKLEKKEQELKKMQTEFDRLMPDICPLCGKEQ